MKKIWLACMIVVGLLGCSREHTVQGLAEYRSFLNDPANGLMKVSKVNGIKISAVYLPQDFLALQELGNKGSSSDFERARAEYQEGKTFMLIFESEEKGRDLVYHGLSKPEEYNQRQYDLNFVFGNAVSLKLNDKTELLPKLHYWENTYGLRDKKILQVVFSDQQLQSSQDLVLQFADPIFESGISQFVFNQEHLNQLPRVIFNR